MAGKLLHLLKLLAPTVVVLGAVEVALRVLLGAPTGTFDFLKPAVTAGLYAPDTVQRLDFGPIPYLVHSDALGLRRTRAEGTASRSKGRIVAIGDSVTDGFYVDDEATWPFVLQGLLDAELGSGWQVLNAARGGASLPKELEILREVALPLEPSVVLLTLVTNDLGELRDGRLAKLRAYRLGEAESLPWYERAGVWIATETALGETLLRLYWDAAIRSRPEEMPGFGDARYRIEGGHEFQLNSRHFLGLYAKNDGIVHEEPFAPETEALLARYVALLDEFVSECRAAGATPVLVYFPSYPQIYLPGTSMRLRDELAAAAARQHVDFADLTPALRSAGRGRVLHLAPLDYHPNPEGHRVIARAVFDFLRDRGLVR